MFKQIKLINLCHHCANPSCVYHCSEEKTREATIEEKNICNDVIFGG